MSITPIAVTQLKPNESKRLLCLWNVVPLSMFRHAPIRKAQSEETFLKWRQVEESRSGKKWSRTAKLKRADSLARCEKDSQLKCKIGRWNSNGVIILYKDAQDSLLASGGLSESDAKKGVKEVCKKARRKCEALAVFDTRQAGVVTRSFPDRPVAK